jgi:hypothetical protein
MENNQIEYLNSEIIKDILIGLKDKNVEELSDLEFKVLAIFYYYNLQLCYLLNFIYIYNKFYPFIKIFSYIDQKYQKIKNYLFNYFY